MPFPLLEAYMYLITKRPNWSAKWKRVIHWRTDASYSYRIHHGGLWLRVYSILPQLWPCHLSIEMLLEVEVPHRTYPHLRLKLNIYIDDWCCGIFFWSGHRPCVPLNQERTVAEFSSEAGIDHVFLSIKSGPSFFRHEIAILFCPELFEAPQWC